MSDVKIDAHAQLACLLSSAIRTRLVGLHLDSGISLIPRPSKLDRLLSSNKNHVCL